jgi:hypothetical protein
MNGDNTPQETPKAKNLMPPWQPGQSGNPDGRPKNSRNKTTLMLEALFEGEAEEIARKAVELAKAGDGPVLRAMLDRLSPPRKDSPITLDLPNIETAADTKAASAAVLAAVAAGNINPSEGQAVMALLTAHRAIVETEELEARIAALEAKGGK